MICIAIYTPGFQFLESAQSHYVQSEKSERPTPSCEIKYGDVQARIFTITQNHTHFWSLQTQRRQWGVALSPHFGSAYGYQAEIVENGMKEPCAATKGTGSLNHAGRFILPKYQIKTLFQWHFIIKESNVNMSRTCHNELLIFTVCNHGMMLT